MMEIIEKIKRNKIVSLIAAVIVILLVILGVLFGTGVISADKLAFMGNQEANVIESDVFGAGNILSVEVEKISEPVMFMNVTFPVFSETDMFDYDGEKTSCDHEIVWVTAQVAPTKAILNATLQKMFNFSSDSNYIPTSYVEDQENLVFEEAKIESGIAKIYLTGELKIEDECDAQKPWIQLEETALVFDTVIGVQVFLNGELIR